MEYSIGFIGAGNMGGALLRAVRNGGADVAVFDTNAEKAKGTGADPLSPEEIAARDRSKARRWSCRCGAAPRLPAAGYRDRIHGGGRADLASLGAVRDR